MTGCPFYGYRWPERSQTLRPVGGGECGLDFEKNGACRMQAEGKEVNFFACSTAQALKAFLTAGERYIRVGGEDVVSITLLDWKRQRSARPDAA